MNITWTRKNVTTIPATATMICGFYDDCPCCTCDDTAAVVLTYEDELHIDGRTTSKIVTIALCDAHRDVW